VPGRGPRALSDSNYERERIKPLGRRPRNSGGLLAGAEKYLVFALQLQPDGPAPAPGPPHQHGANVVEPVDLRQIPLRFASASLVPEPRLKRARTRLQAPESWTVRAPLPVTMACTTGSRTSIDGFSPAEN